MAPICLSVQPKGPGPGTYLEPHIDVIHLTLSHYTRLFASPVCLIYWSPGHSAIAVSTYHIYLILSFLGFNGTDLSINVS